MTGYQRTAPVMLTINVARGLFAGAIVGSCAVGVAVPAYASPCDPLGIAMTPQPVLSCSGPDSAAPTDPSVAPGPVNNVASPPPAGALPAPGQPPSVPPVAPGDGPAPGSQLGYLREIWHDFHNGVPSDLLYGPAPEDPAQPPPPPTP
jgi:hypothetical protein